MILFSPPNFRYTCIYLFNIPATYYTCPFISILFSQILSVFYFGADENRWRQPRKFGRPLCPFCNALCSSVSGTGPFKKQYFKVCSIIQAIGESGGQVVMSDSAGSCAEGMSTSTKSSTGSGILTLTLKGSKRILLQLITLIESIQCKEIYLWTKKFLFF